MKNEQIVRRSKLLNFDVVWVATIAVVILLAILGWRDQKSSNDATRLEIARLHKEFRDYRRSVVPVINLMKAVAQSAGIDSNLVEAIPPADSIAP